MATTVTAASLMVTINESIELNGVTYGNSISKSFVEQGEVDQRIMSIASSEEAFTEILYLSTVDSRGQVVVANYAYFRITNLDDANFMTLQLYVSATSSYFLKLEAGESFLLMSPDMGVDIVGGLPALADVTRIYGIANSPEEADVDIEYVVVTQGAAG
jgi:hypothetical protein